MMKDYIFNRIKESERILNYELDVCLRYRKAHECNHKEIMDKVLAPLQIKTMPKVYKGQMLSTFSFCWQREIASKFLYPVLFNGKLYSKWDAMPEECKEMLRKAKIDEALTHRPYPVFVHHFTEGMNAYK